MNKEDTERLIHYILELERDVISEFQTDETWGQMQKKLRAWNNVEDLLKGRDSYSYK